jgi:methylated-DNA-[protein]-cysteine S-methyltransferase
MIHCATFESPIGPLTLASHDGRVCLLHFGDADPAVHRTLRGWYPADAIEEHPDPAGAATRLGRYFAGQLDAVDGIEVELNGTVFQKRVWNALLTVRAGRTAAYTEIARAIGAPSAIRAVGAANGANPVAVIVPCHRIIGSNGRLTGYGGGLDRKRWLLEHEGRLDRGFPEVYL